MSLRSLTTCSYVSDATSFAMRHCTIVVTPLPMSPEPDSFISREFMIDQMHQATAHTVRVRTVYQRAGKHGAPVPVPEVRAGGLYLVYTFLEGMPR